MILAIIGFVISLAVAVGAGLVAKLTQKITSAVIGGIAGFFLGFILYSLVFAQFVKSTTALLWITIILTTGFGSYAMSKWEEIMEVHVTHFMGAYMIIRGLSFFLGGYPNEAETYFQLSNGNFNLPASFYGYFVLFIVLNVAGGWFQYHKNYHLETPSKTRKGLNKGDYQNAENLVNQDHV